MASPLQEFTARGKSGLKVKTIHIWRTLFCSVVVAHSAAVADDFLLPGSDGERLEEPVPAEQIPKRKTKEDPDSATYYWLYSGGALATGAYLTLGAKAVYQWANNRPYVLNGKPYGNTCHSVFQFLSHRRVSSENPSEPDQLVRRSPSVFHLPPLVALASVGGHLLFESEGIQAEDPEQKKFEAILQAFYEAPFEAKAMTLDEVKKQLKESKPLLKFLSQLYGEERAQRLILAVLQSPEWQLAFEEMIAASSLEDLEAIQEKHRPILEAFLKKYANKRESGGPVTEVIDHLGIKDSQSAQAWHVKTQEPEAQKNARQILPRVFFKRDLELPWDDFPKIKSSFEETRGRVFSAIVDSNKTLPPLHSEKPFTNASVVEGDRELLNEQHLAEMSGIPEVRGFMPASTQHLIDDIFGPSHSDLADLLMMEISNKWKYPDLMLNYQRARDRQSKEKAMQEELAFIRSLLKTEGDPKLPMANPKLEKLAQWTAAYLVVFGTLDQELPKDDDRIAVAIETLKKRLKGK